VDERIYTVGQYVSQRLERIRRDDLPILTRTLIAVIRQRGKARSFTLKGKSLVELTSEEASIVIMREDWLLIEPFLIDGSFEPLVNPSNPRVGYGNQLVAYGESVIDRADVFLYERIIGLLGQIFTEAYPTSDL
jgi:hypothetical protein